MGIAVLLTLAAVGGPSCGTRVQTPEGVSASPPVSAPALETTSPTVPGGVGASDPGPDAAVPVGGPTSSGGGAVGGSDVASGSRGAQKPSGGAASRGTVSTGPGAAADAGPAASGTTDRTAPSPVPGTGGPPGQGEGSPKAATQVVIASVGTYSGPVGAVFNPGMQTVQAWVRYVNDQGGLSGHQVRYVVYDDGGDPARHRSQVQDAVEKERAMAFVHNAEAISGQGSTEYVTGKRIPVIGSEGASPWFYDSPTYFPQASVGLLVHVASVYSAAQLAIPAGARKVATVACVEAEACAQADRIWADTAPRVGFDLVYRGRASLTQPDFTAECLAARNAGAQLVYIGMDTNSAGRLTASCARQGYRPRYATVAPVPADHMKNDPNLDGLTASSSVFPYFQQGTPATDEYQQVMQRYGDRIVRGTSSAFGWVSAKLFQRVATGLPEPPTSEAILRGLWTLKDETLGGLTLPLTFLQGQNAPKRTCWFNLQVADGAWRSPDRFGFHCQ